MSKNPECLGDLARLCYGTPLEPRIRLAFMFEGEEYVSYDENCNKRMQASLVGRLTRCRLYHGGEEVFIGNVATCYAYMKGYWKGTVR